MGTICMREEPIGASQLSEFGVPSFNDEFRLGAKLGAGQYGEVHYATTSDNVEIAVKVMPIPNAPTHIIRMTREIQILRQTSHPGVVRYYGCYMSKGQLFIGMELCKGGNVKERVNKGVISEEDGRKLAVQILGALCHLHKAEIVHRDIKPENILFDEEGNAKLADFGLSRMMMAAQKMTVVGTPFYLAPEIRQGIYNEKCDIWSFGVVMYYVFVRKLPFRGASIPQVFHKICNKTLKTWGDMSPGAVEFVKKMLIRDPAERPSAEELLRHPWLQVSTPSTSHSANLSECPHKSMDVEVSSQSSEPEDFAAYQLTSEVWMVPCSIDLRTNIFIPLAKPTFDHMTERFPSKQLWLPQEDELLRRIIVGKGTKAWTSIAQELNLQMHQGAAVRHGKQCRERWYNHLDPNLRKGNWSPSEDLLVLEKQLEVGNRWSDISKLLPGRNENSVKNRWKSMVRKAQKELPSGTDVIQWLIAERKSQDQKSPDSISLISPLVCSNSPLPQFPMNMIPVAMPTMNPIAFQVMAVDSVKRDLRNMEQPTQQFSWQPYEFKGQKDTSMSPSTFLAF